VKINALADALDGLIFSRIPEKRRKKAVWSGVEQFGVSATVLRGGGFSKTSEFGFSTTLESPRSPKASASC